MQEQQKQTATAMLANQSQPLLKQIDFYGNRRQYKTAAYPTTA
jgi:hypothetical protein